MKLYRVDVDRAYFYFCYIEANSAADAVERYMAGDFDLTWDGDDTTRIEAEEVSDAR